MQVPSFVTESSTIHPNYSYNTRLQLVFSQLGVNFSSPLLKQLPSKMWWYHASRAERLWHSLLKINPNSFIPIGGHEDIVAILSCAIRRRVTKYHVNAIQWHYKWKWRWLRDEGLNTSLMKPPKTLKASMSPRTASDALERRVWVSWEALGIHHWIKTVKSRVWSDPNSVESFFKVVIRSAITK